MELKPALTYAQQIDRLIEVHNLTINDRTEAEEIIKIVNYYRLSAYGIGLKKPFDKEQYRDGITLQMLFDLYCFDSQFKNNLIHTIEQLEIQLRTQISNYLALKYGPEGYMDSSNFLDIKNRMGKSVHAGVIEHFQSEVKRQKNVPFVKHHLDKYEGHFPVWVAVELFTFGNLSSLYSIMKAEDQKNIADLYQTKPKYLKSWILSLVEIRNICAHYTRLYNLPLKQTPFLYKEHRVYRQQHSNKIFPVLLVIKRMLNSNSQWKALLHDICDTIDKYQSVICFSFMGFPQDWRNILSE